MKKYLFVILLTLHFINAKSQAWIYHPMPDTNAVWRVDRSNGFPCVIPGLYQSYQYTIEGDTVIGTNFYKKIFWSGIGDICFSNPYYVKYYRGAMRDDTINKKVYFYYPPSGHDTLLYDFSLSIGDTLYRTLTSSTNPSPNFIIQSIDSALVGSNYHKRFNLANSFSFIEEVGGSSGLLEPLGPMIDDSYTLICFSHNQDFYPSASTSCPLISNTINISEIQPIIDNLNISPNPISYESVIELSNKSDIIKEINIYNILGELVLSYKNIISYKFIIKKNELTKGIYFLKINTRDNKLITSKFLIT